MIRWACLLVAIVPAGCTSPVDPIGEPEAVEPAVPVAATLQGPFARPLTEPSAGQSAQAVIYSADITCGGCAWQIEDVLQKQPGYQKASVDVATRTALVTFDPSITSAEAMLGAVTKLGYEASIQLGVQPLQAPVTGTGAEESPQSCVTE